MGCHGGSSRPLGVRPDATARDALVLEHLHLVPAVARRLGVACWDDLVAADRDDYLAAGAEALVRAARTWQPDAGSPFAPYAWAAIAWAMRYEQCWMRWRHQGRARPGRVLLSLHAPLRHDPEHPTVTIAEVLAAPGDPDGTVELRAAIEEAIDRLPPKLREAVRLCWLADLPQQDAARLLGVTQSAVSQRLRLARRELAGALAEVLAA